MEHQQPGYIFSKQQPVWAPEVALYGQTQTRRMRTRPSFVARYNDALSNLEGYPVDQYICLSF